ncbi:MAG: response regulator [Phycisphaerales bacterium]|nr:response regulator [Phycisphaerales bacterium]
MGRTEPRLFIVIPEGVPTELGAAGDRLVITASLEEARAARDLDRGDRLINLRDDLPLELLRHVGHAMVLVDETGSSRWSDDRFTALPESIQKAVQDRLSTDTTDGSVKEGSISVEDRSFYLLACRTASAPQTLVVLVEITWMQQQRDRRAALRAAGLALRDLDRSIVADLAVADRLRLLEDRIVRCIHEELSFDNFEIRLLDRASNRLELVIAKNLTPLKIGEVIQAGESGNGISGWVAATGQPYICPNVTEDPRYREGLDDAASSLTVPLKMHQQVIGVLNVESLTPNAFNRDDLELAEILAHYIADAMHMLDLLVVERFTTREQATRSALDQLDEPLGELRDVAMSLRAMNPDDTAFQGIVDKLVNAASNMRLRLEACVSGPRSILDAEHELKRLRPDEALSGQHILVTDDEPRIREEMFRLLTQVGCRVTVCENGSDTLDFVQRAKRTHDTIDLVITDIKLPDLTGYEVFTGARDCFPDVPVILMTGFGYDPSHSIVRASQEGVSAVLFKPFRTSQLLDAVRSASQVTTPGD